MRIVRWTPPARTAYLRFLRDLTGLSQPAAARAAAAAAIETKLDSFAVNPRLGHHSRRWRQYREWSFTAHHKLLVYESAAQVLHVVAFYDMRQDLDRVRP